MIEAPTRSNCINHPVAPAKARCKQCGKPVCGVCIVAGPTGQFCSDACREKHELFIGQTKEYDVKARSTGLGILHRFWKLLGGLLGLSAVLFTLGVIATIVEIPVLSGIVRIVRGFIGI